MMKFTVVALVLAAVAVIGVGVAIIDDSPRTGEASDEASGIVNSRRAQPARLALVPASTGYDPIKLMRAKDLPPVEVFQREPRDKMWAPRYEALLATRATRDLTTSLPEAELISVECRHSSCQVIVRAPDELVQNLLVAFPIPILGTVGSVDPGQMVADAGYVLATYILLFRPEHRNEQSYLDSYRARRANVVTGIAGSGGLPNGKKLPKE